MSDRRLPPSMGGPRSTPQKGEDVVVRATRDQAIPPEVLPRLKLGVPPEEGVPADQGIPPEEGIPVEEAVLPGDGIMPDEEDALIPGSPGQLDPGAPGQVDRGAPGQMDPWAENPWAAEEVGFDAGAEEDEVAEDVWPSDDTTPVEQGHGEFFAAQPNFLDLPELENDVDGDRAKKVEQAFAGDEDDREG